MRNAFAAEMVSLAEQNPDLVLLSGDIGNRLFDKFKLLAADRFYNCGVAEANMIGVAAGLALSGLRPVVYTIAPFLTYRVIEQIRLDLCYHKAPAVLVGTGSGLRYAGLGPTHHSLEEMAMLRAIPGMTVLAPADAIELRACLRDALDLDGPAYIRIGKKGEAAQHERAVDHAIGRHFVLREGADVCLLAAGVMVAVAQEVASIMTDRGVAVQVVSVPTVKPLGTELLADAFDSFPLVVTLEEHGLIGGYGAAVAEWLADLEFTPRARLLRFGTGDTFLHQAGEIEFAHHHWGLDALSVSNRISDRLSRLTDREP